MNAITYSYARQNMASIMKAVCNNNEPTIITSPGKKVVMISLDDYNSLIETCYLLSNPANANHLRESIQALDAGQGIAVDLADV